MVKIRIQPPMARSTKEQHQEMSLWNSWANPPCSFGELPARSGRLLERPIRLLDRAERFSQPARIAVAAFQPRPTLSYRQPGPAPARASRRLAMIACSVMTVAFLPRLVMDPRSWPRLHSLTQMSCATWLVMRAPGGRFIKRRSVAPAASSIIFSRETALLELDGRAPVAGCRQTQDRRSYSRNREDILPCP